MRFIIAVSVSALSAASVQAETPDGQQIMDAYWSSAAQYQSHREGRYISHEGRYVMFPDGYTKLWEYKAPEKFFCETVGAGPLAPDYLCTVMLVWRDSTIPGPLSDDSERFALLDAREFQESRKDLAISATASGYVVPDVAILHGENGVRSFFLARNSSCQTIVEVTGRGTAEAEVEFTTSCTSSSGGQIANVNCDQVEIRQQRTGLPVDVSNPAFWQSGLTPVEYVACLE